MVSEELPKLSPKQAMALEAFRANGGDAVAAYMTAYPNSMNWKPETVARKAAALFKTKGMKLHLGDDAPAAKKKRKSPSKPRTPAQIAAKPPRPPSKLTDKVKKLIKDYPDKYFDEHEHPFPSVVGLAKICGVHKETIYEWTRSNVCPEINLPVVLDKIRSNREFELITKGFNGEGNAAITKMLLKVHHGYVEKDQVEVMGPGGGPIQSQTMGVEITAEMKPEDAFQLYRDAIAGGVSEA